MENSPLKILQLSLMQMSGLHGQCKNSIAAVITFYCYNIREEVPGFQVRKSHSESIKSPPLTSLQAGTASLVVWRAQSLVKVKAMRPRDQGWEPGACSLGHCWPLYCCVSTGPGKSLAHSPGGDAYAFSFVFLAPTKTSSD